MCIKIFFGGLNCILFVLGCIVIATAVSLGDDPWLSDMVKDAGISFESGIEMSEKMYKSI